MKSKMDGEKKMLTLTAKLGFFSSALLFTCTVIGRWYVGNFHLNIKSVGASESQ